MRNMDTSSVRPDGDIITVEDAVSPDRCRDDERCGQRRCAPCRRPESSNLEGAALEAWRSYLQSHASIVRLARCRARRRARNDDARLRGVALPSPGPGPAAADVGARQSTMLTRSGITRLVDGLVAGGLIERVACDSDARVSYARLTDRVTRSLREAGCTHVASIRGCSSSTSAPRRSSSWQRFSPGCRARAARAAARWIRRPRMSALGSQPRASRADPPDTSIGAVRLTVADLEGSRAFYERALGLRAVRAATTGRSPSEYAGEQPL